MKRLLLAIITSLTGLFSLAQWSNNPVEPFWVNTQDEYFYTYEVQMAPNGNTWLWYNSGEDFHYLQLFDSTGVARFGEEMLLVSDYENRLTGYVNQNLFVDRDGNAIVVVSDLRYSSISEDLATFTAYKISQEGEFLWGKDGISLDGGKGTHLAAMMGIVQLSDGSYVFTWTHGNDEDIFTIELQRLSAEGELLWNADETRLTDPQGKVTYFWPFIVEAEYGQCILLYTKGSNLAVDSFLPPCGHSCVRNPRAMEVLLLPGTTTAPIQVSSLYICHMSSPMANWVSVPVKKVKNLVTAIFVPSQQPAPTIPPATHS